MDALIADLKFVGHGDVLAEVLSLHRREQDFIDGMLLHRLDRFAEYVLLSLPIDSLNLNEYGFVEATVEEYAQRYREIGSCPRIVIDGIEGSIVDGFHRALALRRCGVEMIDAYVGIEGRLNPLWSIVDMEDDSQEDDDLNCCDESSEL